MSPTLNYLFARMANQVTNVASLPAGYPTLAGTIYAVSSTSPKRWAGLAWRRIVPAEKAAEGGSVWLDVDQGLSASDRDAAGPELLSRRICRVWMKKITQGMRSCGADFEDSPFDYIAAFHILASTAEEPIHLAPNVEAPTDIKDVERASSAESRDEDPNPRIPTSATTFRSRLDVLLNASKTLPAVKVYVHGSETTVESSTTVVLTADRLGQLIQEAGFSLRQRSLSTIIERAYLVHFNDAVYVQGAASRYMLMLEAAYKAIEVLVSCGVVLGSTGGAWFGLTIGSLFPEHTAAGLYRSSYGQSVPRGQHYLNEEPVRWRSVGTLWTEPATEDSSSYTVAPITVLSDERRDAIGYILQYAALLVLQKYKLWVRGTMDFGPYAITVDGVRYVLLAVEFFVLLTTFVALTRSSKRQSLSRRGKLTMAVYIVTLMLSLTAVVLGQKAFLKPVWKFYLVSKIVDPVATVGTLALMNITWKGDHGRRMSDETGVLPEQWVLLWALGACTVVW